MKKYILAIIMAVVILNGCSKEEVRERAEDVVRVKTEMASVHQYTPQLKYSGTVSAIHEANLGTTLPGKIEKYYYEEGDKVKAGSLIAELSDELLQQAEIEYKTFEKDFQRMERLREKGSVPEMDYDHIKAQYEAKRENYEMVRKNTQIRAPFDGTIIEYLVEEGENYLFNINLEPGYSRTSGVVRFMALDNVKVEFEIGERDIADVASGLAVEIEFPAYAGRKFTGEISECKPYLNQISRTMTAVVILDNKAGLLKPGMFAEVNVMMPEKTSVMVPLQSIKRLPGTGDDIIYIVKNGKALSRNIKRLYTMGDLTAVSGISVGEEFIISGKSKVDSGQEVKVVNGEE